MGDSIVVVVQVVLKDQEDVLCWRKQIVCMLPLLPSLWAQLGEIVYQALPFLCRHVGNRLLALQLHKLPRARQQFVGDALAAVFYLPPQVGDGLFTGLAALL